MRTPEMAMTMGSAAIWTNASRAASTETPAEQTLEAKPQADARCDFLGVLESTGDAAIDLRSPPSLSFGAFVS
jgi:hypothetical protein